MNYYKHHIGDYLKDTGGLTLLQHGAYLLLLMNFYATEKPLPADEVHSIAKAFGKPERDAVDKVLAKYWLLTGDGYVNGRASEEITQDRAFIDKQRDSGKAGAAKRWGKPSDSDPISDPIVLAVARTSPSTPTPTPIKEGEGILQAVNGHAHPMKSKRKASRVPPEFTPDASLALGELPDLDLEREVTKFRDWEFKTPRSDWAAVWRTWIGNAKETGKYARRAEAKIAWR